MQSPLRIIFAGTPTFAAKHLEEMYDRGFVPTLVITQPDKPVGRKNNLTPPPVKLLANKLNLQIIQPQNINSVCKVLTEKKPDLIVVVAFGQLLSAEVLAVPKYGCWNLHASILPKWRGAAPIEYSLLNNDKQTGVSLMQMDTGLDTGAVIASKAIGINQNENVLDLTTKLANIGKNLLVENIKRLEVNSIENLATQPQNDKFATYAKKINTADKQIDWEQSSLNIHNKIRAFYPSCWSLLRDDKNKTIRVKLVSSYLSKPEPEGQLNLEEIQKAQVGQITKLVKLDDLAGGKKAIAIKTVDNVIYTTQLQPEGKKLLSAEEFYNGYKNFCFCN